VTPPLALPIDHPGWRFFSDRVMGGVSDGEAMVETVAGRRAIRLRGTVALDQGGGFLQVACPLGTSSYPVFDASSLAGIELDVLVVSGPPAAYAVHLRTADTRAPWQVYVAPLPAESAVSAEPDPDPKPEPEPEPGPWRTVFLPWSAFRPQSLRLPLDPTRLQRVGLAASGAAFEADLAVARIAFVEGHPSPQGESRRAFLK
jgi:hypothetical protein